MQKLRFAFVVHNHQPVGNFDGVFAAAYADAYEPFLGMMEAFPAVKFGWHASGCLLEWLETHRPEFLPRLRTLVDRGQAEILGGGFYEPILPMIPRRDRLTQLRSYADYLRDKFGAEPRGVWLAERVWEQSLTADLVDAGAEYVLLDDFHFLKAGLTADALVGPFVTEDEGRLLRAIPVSETTRYTIPFRPVRETFEYLRALWTKKPDALVVFADDGEKFGAWPETKKSVYDDGWLRDFFTELTAQADWIESITPGEAARAAAVGKTYIPDGSYREMTEWVLPTERHLEYRRLWTELDRSDDGRRVQQFLKGGYWRNYKTRYPETAEMYARMMELSDAYAELEVLRPDLRAKPAFLAGKRALLRGQCNCAYWHGSFGGVYLPHLRNGVYAELIDADNRLAELRHGDLPFVEAAERDLNFDAAAEVRLANPELALYVAPSQGGALYELDHRRTKVNLGASLARRPEAYHERLRTGGELAGIHDAVRFQGADLGKHLFFDAGLRKSLVDRFFTGDPTPADFDRSAVVELGDFADGVYSHRLERGPQSAAIVLERSGTVRGQPCRVGKRISLDDRRSALSVSYRIDAPVECGDLRFGVEFNFAALAGGPDDRVYRAVSRAGERLGTLGSEQTLTGARGLALVDAWLDLAVELRFSTPTGVLAWPVRTISQCEAGFELVHQSACVVCHWPVANGVCEIEIAVDLTPSA